ncbi:hydroxyethylthiazole kinase [Bisgaardia hudsonensis]|uniref:Hydroxyethylthiazole kinase n=1 Tax=Bisgaardia hudsonensis TaxID=109472 RepID=A0A4R2N2R0_9PAST|nr:hydroxyethylthiazole kinase [Bisgaardia hudsonensis]QLB12558.1 hydroxyethylthiazole kinase [Bisgaardia hudsonensis]TCP14099.1 hydroxyethylthiazole kinase [Bisgaardia hudsonensis]
MQFKYLNLIRERNPLVHCITNIVVANYSANGLLALGASPLMSANLDEVAEIQHFSQGLLLNIGTFTNVEAKLLAGKAANKNSVPVVLDPAGCGATQCRKNATETLLNELDIAVLRGNAGELASIAKVDWQVKGVDSGAGNGDIVDIAKKVAKQYQTIVALSGATDIITDGERVAKIHNGTALFPRITGSGCLLGAVCAAFVGVAEEADYFQAVVEACTVYAIAGELAAKPLTETQTGSFSIALLDQLAEISEEKAQQLARVTYE